MTSLKLLERSGVVTGNRAKVEEKFRKLIQAEFCHQTHLCLSLVYVYLIEVSRLSGVK